MARAYVVVNRDVRKAIAAPPYSAQLEVLNEYDMGDGTVMLIVDSERIKPNVSMIQDLILEPEGVRFKSWADT